MRLLVLNIGNSSLISGLGNEKKLTRYFRFPIDDVRSNAGRKKCLASLVRQKPDRIALCSVVPSLTKPLGDWLQKETGAPLLLLTAEAAHNIRIAYREPRRLGMDRLAAALGAQCLHPKKNIVVVDCGTATTVTALDKYGALRGGAIFPGLMLWSKSLASGTAQLPAITPQKPRTCLGRSPEEAIASGLFFGHLGAIESLVSRIAREAFGDDKHLTIATGGMAGLFAREKLFTQTEPHLILTGLRHFAAIHSHA